MFQTKQHETNFNIYRKYLYFLLRINSSKIVSWLSFFCITSHIWRSRDGRPSCCCEGRSSLVINFFYKHGYNTYFFFTSKSVYKTLLKKLNTFKWNKFTLINIIYFLIVYFRIHKSIHIWKMHAIIKINFIIIYVCVSIV